MNLFFKYSVLTNSKWSSSSHFVFYMFFFLFHRLYNHIQQPSKLGFGCDYCLFKVRLFSMCMISSLLEKYSLLLPVSTIGMLRVELHSFEHQCQFVVLVQYCETILVLVLHISCFTLSARMGLNQCGRTTGTSWGVDGWWLSINNRDTMTLTVTGWRR